MELAGRERFERVGEGLEGQEGAEAAIAGAVGAARASGEMGVYVARDAATAPESNAAEGVRCGRLSKKVWRAGPLGQLKRRLAASA